MAVQRVTTRALALDLAEFEEEEWMQRVPTEERDLIRKGARAAILDGALHHAARQDWRWPADFWDDDPQVH